MEPTKPLLCDCGHPPTEDNSNRQFQTLGYAQDNQTGKTICYACCAELDKQTLREGDRWAGYLVMVSPNRWEVSNWPGSLRIPVRQVKENKIHTICGYSRTIDQVNVWFEFEGSWWYGRNQGDNQIVRCKKLKRRPNL